MTKRLYEARVTFFTTIEANSQEEADVKVNELLDALGKVDTPQRWDDVTWDYTYASAEH